MKNIGIVEDDRELSHALKLLLEQHKYQVFQAYTVDEGIKMIDTTELDIVLLDIGLPDGEGFEVSQYLEDGSIPIVYLTARDDEVDMLHAYDNGCEDYVVKPFSMTVLLKRIEVVLRRNEQKGNIFVYKDIELNVERHEVKVNQMLVALTANEFEVLHLFMRNQKRVLSKTQILEAIWDEKEQFVDDSTVTVTISRLRKKLDKDPRKYIENVFGSGYRLVA